jgi:lipopolysaccharide/colanic/teichoic acid biosynthesis glycosyltransferase
MGRRIFDIILSFSALLVLTPLLALLAAWVAIDSPGGAVFTQIRIGKNGRPFRLFKFRSMYRGADARGLLTIGSDSRITAPGRFLRKYKLDELPQLFNILTGDMGFVGPRPEVPRFVELYNQSQLRVLSVRPGLTDYASLAYFDESELLGRHPDPERLYIEEIMPAKLELNLRYIDSRCFWNDMKILGRTLLRIFQSGKRR